jgi:nitroimidazol reductase NimA-like FMN-containing flavoprotein (pyridoxamine 5'-phosphate oxidase superfamily)
MTHEEIVEFLGEDRRFPVDAMLFAAVASVRMDGSPFVVPLGFWYDGEALYLSVGGDRSAPALRMRRDPRVCITVFNHTFPIKFVVMTGTAKPIEDPGQEISRRISRRYPKSHVIDEGEYESFHIDEGRHVFRVDIDEMSSMDLSKRANFAFENFEEEP